MPNGIPRKRTLRVVHMLTYVAHSGGMEKGVGTLIRLASPDIEHVVIAMNEAHDDQTVLPRGTRIISLSKEAGHSTRFIWRLSRLLKELSPSVVHTRNWPGMDGILAARLAGIRAVVHGEHGWGVADLNGTNRRRILVRRLLSRYTRAFLCVSKDIERWLRETVRVRCPVVQIYNGVESAPFAGARTSAELRAELGLPPDALLLGIVGRLDPIKDHPTLFRALTAVRQRFPNTHLLCVGDGPEMESLRKLVVPGVHMLGERRDVPHILRGLDLFVLTSRNEGIANTILEAMAAGLPVVASRVGGNGELVEDGATGRLFPAGDVGALAAAIEGYLAAPDLRSAHGAAGQARVRGSFSTASMVQAYERVWRDCAATCGPKGSAGS